MPLKFYLEKVKIPKKYIDQYYIGLAADAVCDALHLTPERYFLSDTLLSEARFLKAVISDGREFILEKMDGKLEYVLNSSNINLPDEKEFQENVQNSFQRIIVREESATK